MAKSFLGLFDWIQLAEELKKQTHDQVIFSDGTDRMKCPVATIGGHDICGWGVPMQVFRTFIMIAHLGMAVLLVFLLPYQVFFSNKGDALHKKIGFITTMILLVQALGGIGSLALQGVRQFIVMPNNEELPPEMGYVLPLDSKFVFLPMFAMGFVTPIMNGLGKMVLKVPYRVSAIVTLLALFYELGYAYPTMIKRLFTHEVATYEFQMLFELISIGVVYPLQDFGNLLIYYKYFFKGEKFNELEHHANNTRMLTVVALTAVCWFLIHLRVIDGDDQFPIPTFYRLIASFFPFLVMVFNGHFALFMKYTYGLGKEKGKTA